MVRLISYQPIRLSSLTNILYLSYPHSQPIMFSLPSLVNCRIAPKLIAGCRLLQRLNHKHVSHRKNSFPCREIKCLSGKETRSISFCLVNGSLSVQVLGQCVTIVARPLKSEARSRWSLYRVYSQKLRTDTCALL